MSRAGTMWAGVIDAEWGDWRWQQRHRITTLPALEQVVRLSAAERRGVAATAADFRMAITPYYAALMDPDDPGCPIRRQAVPTEAELTVWPGERMDPLDEEGHMPAPGLTHRYPDRALLYATHNCAMYCRFCTRKRKVSDPTSQLARTALDEALDHVARTPAIREVIVSGGDPLSLSNTRLDAILARLEAIDHVEVARIGTRNLVTLPQRVDGELCDVLRSHQTRRLSVWVMTHFNHPRECTDDAWAACERVAATGTSIQNQMVLLDGINDQADVVVDLNRRLLRMRVKPYYILYADMAQGIGHFRAPIERGLRVIDALRGHVTGLAVPQFVVDLPGGGGKVPLVPDYVTGRGEGAWHFRNYRGEPFALVEGDRAAVARSAESA